MQRRGLWLRSRKVNWVSDDKELSMDGDKEEMLLPCKERLFNWERWERENSG